jgi:hypothetical protein
MIDQDTIAQIASRTVDTPSLIQALPTTPEAILSARKNAPRDSDPMAVSRNVIDLVDDSESMTKAVNLPSEEIDGVAPKTAQDVRDAMSRALFFLASKAPKESPSAPGMPPLPPPKQDVLKFQRYIRAIDDPMSIMDDAEEGSLSPEAVEAVKTIYPQMYQAMQTEIASRIGNAPKISYSRRLQLSVLLGQDMTGTLKPAVALGAQSAYASSQGADQKKQMPVSRAQGLNMADRAEYNTAARQEAQRGVGMWNKRG